MVYAGKKHFLYDMEILDDEEVMKFVGEVVKYDYLEMCKAKRMYHGNLKAFKETEWKLYVNGAEVKSLTQSLSLPTGGELEIGRYFHSQPPDGFWDGKIDSVLVYNRTLSL